MTREKTIPISNIYYMLAYAFTELHQGEFQSLAGEPFSNIHSLFAAMLSAGIGRQLKQGLYRTYQTHTQSMETVRGRIQMAGTIRSRAARSKDITCTYEALTENNLFNQILKTSLRLLLTHPDVADKYDLGNKRGAASPAAPVVSAARGNPGIWRTERAAPELKARQGLIK